MPGLFDDDDAKREILTLAFDNQTQYVRLIDRDELRILGGFLTLQLVLGGWLSESPPTERSIAGGFFIIDLAFSIVAANFLRMNNKRKQRAVDTLGNIVEAIGFTEKVQFPVGRKIMEPPKSRTALSGHMIAIGASVFGIALIICSKLACALC